MGYTTKFKGFFTLNRELQNNHYIYLLWFSKTRRVKWNTNIIEKYSDPVREKVGLPLGPEGAYFVGSGFFPECNPEDVEHLAMKLQDMFFQDKGVKDPNSYPGTQFSFHCDWCPNRDKKTISWNKAEKFYNYVEWIEYLIEHFLEPWGYVLNGKVSYKGEGHGRILEGLGRISDKGIISVEGNKLKKIKEEFVETVE